MQHHFARPLERFESLNHRHHLHAIVRGQSLTAKQLFLRRPRFQKHAPAPRARIAFAGTVGVDDDGVHEALES
jgi:hypothetical protein